MQTFLIIIMSVVYTLLGFIFLGALRAGREYWKFAFLTLALIAIFPGLIYLFMLPGLGIGFGIAGFMALAMAAEAF
jgi:hypothetical protein